MLMPRSMLSPGMADDMAGTEAFSSAVGPAMRAFMAAAATCWVCGISR